jgi:hypothetical protein
MTKAAKQLNFQSGLQQNKKKAYLFKHNPIIFCKNFPLLLLCRVLNKPIVNCLSNLRKQSCLNSNSVRVPACLIISVKVLVFAHLQELLILLRTTLSSHSKGMQLPNCSILPPFGNIIQCKVITFDLVVVCAF